METIVVRLPDEGLVPFELMYNAPPRPADPERSIRERPARLGFLGLGKSKTYELVKRGHLPPPIRVGKRALIDVRVAREVKDRLAAHGIAS